jgi:hypothetical protein
LKKKTSPWVWVGLGCGLVTVGAAAFFAFIFFVIFAAMRSSEPYKAALEMARNDSRVQELLGTPIEPGVFVGGNINTQNRDGSADLTIPIKGPKGKATLRVIGTKTDGRWAYTSIRVVPESGPVIELLEGPSRAGFPRTAPRAS